MMVDGQTFQLDSDLISLALTIQLFLSEQMERCLWGMQEMWLILPLLHCLAF